MWVDPNHFQQFRLQRNSKTQNKLKTVEVKEQQEVKNQWNTTVKWKSKPGVLFSLKPSYKTMLSSMKRYLYLALDATYCEIINFLDFLGFSVALKSLLSTGLNSL